MGLSDLFKSKKQTTTLEEMISPEQKRAREMLMQYGLTGSTPTGYQAGQGYDLSGFDFGLSPYEMQGLTDLGNLQGGDGAGMGRARDVLMQLADTRFAPDDQSTGLGAFRSLLAREMGSASDVLNREAAITGGRFGTAIAGEKRDLAAQQSDIIASKLADLFTGQQNRAMSAAQGLAGLEGQSQNMAINRLNAMFNYGQRQRDLQNQKAQLEYNDWQRKRDEQLSSLGTLGSIYGQNNNWGQMSYTTKTPSLFSQLAGTVMSGVGTAMGGPIGGAIGNSIARLFGNIGGGMKGWSVNNGNLASQVSAFGGGISPLKTPGF